MTAVLSLSVLANVLLLFLLLAKREARAWVEGMADGEPVSRPKFRRYAYFRHKDISNFSGTGLVFEVAEFSDGHAAIHWLGDRPLTTPHPNGIKEIMEIHDHNGNGKLVLVE